MDPKDGADDLSLTALRERVDRVNRDLLERLQERAALVLEIAEVKRARGLGGFDPGREDAMLEDLLGRSSGPFGATELRTIFRTIFRASLEIQERDREQALLVKQPGLMPAGGVRVGTVAIGDGVPVMIAGPCSAESAEQMETVAGALAALPGRIILRAGAYKPRTNPYSFQGLREEGLDIIQAAARRHRLPTVTEVLDITSLDRVASQTDMLQVGSRNMYNTELLKALGRVDRPVLLKRGFMATLEEFLLAAEYIVSAGNPRVVLCERGIRTFERATRNTLDISAVPILKRETSLPVIVDLSHSLGRRDIVLPCGRAALAAGADGLMVEVHPDPDRALSDGFQQLDLKAFEVLMEGLGLMEKPASAGHVTEAVDTAVPPPGRRPPSPTSTSRR
jgi:3-deoxy-7-phosphoheptulonate synthase/chorismate mutase